MQHVLCRLQCVHFDVTGSRLPLACGSDQTFVTALDECVPLSIASLPEFIPSFQWVKRCHGGVVETSEQLERLRFCNVITTSLTIAVNDRHADFSAVRDISIIMGVLWLACKRRVI